MTTNNRTKLLNTVDEINGQISDLRTKQDEAYISIDGVVEAVLATGEINLKDYASANNRILLFDEVIEALRKRKQFAELELWKEDFRIASENHKKAVQTALDARLEVIAVQKDKPNLLRESVKMDPNEKIEKMAALEILLLNARKNSLLSEQDRENKKAIFDSLRLEYKKVEQDLECPLEEILAMANK